jgi:hypothetical protein
MHGDVRASDAERDSVAERLTLALTQGRLTVDEYEARVTAVYASRTRGELVALTRDLPGSLW